MAYIVVREGYHDEADFCETLEDVRTVLADRHDNDGDYFEQIAGEFSIYPVDTSNAVDFHFRPASIVIDGMNPEPVAETPSTTPEAGIADFELLDLLTRRGTDREPFPLRNEEFVLSQDSPNDYSSGPDKPIIPAGSTIRIDFSGDFGLYGFVNLGGVIEKVKIDLKHLVKRDFNVFM